MINIAISNFFVKAEVFEIITSVVKKDKEYISQLIQINGDILIYADKSLQNDRDLVALALDHKLHSLLFASEEIQKDRNFALKVLRNNLYSIKYVHKSFYEDPIYMLEAIKRDPFNIKYVQNKLKDDLNLALIAIKKDIQSYIYLSKSLQENKVIKAYLPKQKKISTFIKPSKEERKGAIRGVSINFLLVSTELNDNYKYNIISPPKGMKIINKLRQGNGCLNNYTGDKGKSALYIQWEIPMDIEEGKIYKITVKGIDKEGYVEEISFPIEVPKTKPIQTKIINNELIVTDKAQTFTV